MRMNSAAIIPRAVTSLTMALLIFHWLFSFQPSASTCSGTSRCIGEECRSRYEGCQCLAVETQRRIRRALLNKQDEIGSEMRLQRVVCLRYSGVASVFPFRRTGVRAGVSGPGARRPPTESLGTSSLRSLFVPAALHGFEQKWSPLSTSRFCAGVGLRYKGADDTTLTMPLVSSSAHLDGRPWHGSAARGRQGWRQWPYAPPYTLKCFFVIGKLSLAALE